MAKAAKKTKTQKKWLTVDDLSHAYKTMSKEDFEAFEAKFWEQHKINPETDFYPADVAKQRFDAVLKAISTGANWVKTGVKVPASKKE